MQHPESEPFKGPTTKPGLAGGFPPKPAAGDVVDHQEVEIKPKDRTADMQRMETRNKDIQAFVAAGRSKIVELQLNGEIPSQTVMDELVANPKYLHQFNKSTVVGDQPHQLKFRYANWSMTYQNFWQLNILDKIPLANKALGDIFCNHKVSQKQRIGISRKIQNPEKLTFPHDYMFAFVVCLFGTEWIIWRTVNNFKTLHSKSGVKASLPKDTRSMSSEDSSTSQLDQLGLELQKFMNEAVQEVTEQREFEVLMHFLGISQSFCETRCLRILETEVYKESAGRKNEGCFSRCLKSMCGGWNKRWLGIGYNAIWYYEDHKQKAENLRDSIYLDQESSLTIKAISHSEVIIGLRLNRRVLILKIKDLAHGLNAISAIMQSFVESVSTKSHQFGSFAPLRQFNSIDFFVRGKRYFETMERLIQEAKYEIVICDWMFSPEFPLTRPLTGGSNLANASNRILNLLGDAANNRNVNVYILLYKEFVTLYNDAERAKAVMESLTPVTKKIKVICHNEKFASLWSHHEKMVIIDRHFGMMGGLDIAWGRWDNEEVALFDYSKDSSLFPGVDYYNPFHKELIKISGNGYQEKLTPSEHPRMPWQDLAICIKGPAVYDLLTHFMTYWNNARELTVEDEEVITGHILVQQLKTPNVSPGGLYIVEAKIAKDGESVSNKFASCCKRKYREADPQKEAGTVKQDNKIPQNKKDLKATTDMIAAVPDEEATHDESDESLSFSFDYSTDPSDDEGEFGSKTPKPEGEMESQPQIPTEANKESYKPRYRSKQDFLENTEYSYQQIISDVKTDLAANQHKVTWIGEVLPQACFMVDNDYKYNASGDKEKFMYLAEDSAGEATPKKPGDGTSREMRKAETENWKIQDSINLHASLNSSHSAATTLFKRLKAVNPKLEYLFHGLRDVPLPADHPVLYSAPDNTVPQIPFETPEGFFRTKEGTMSAQVLRSASPWSIGLREAEHSIYNCYIELIMGAKHFIYIENQFFMSYAKGSPVNESMKNSIGRALFLRIQRAYQNQEAFKVIVFIPLLPANEGDLEAKGNKQSQLMIAIQNFTIGEGESSLYESIRNLGANPEDYIMFGSLRKWAFAPSNKTDPTDPKKWLPDQENPKTELIYIHSKVRSNLC
jgi:phosphatidylserine/phosphatidylglycerophosphate/cardiolipin synthase-like enzyme